MQEIVSTRWAGVARRFLISVFVVIHLGATLLMVMPNCPIRSAWLPTALYYILPLGLCQSWGMFCPDPPMNLSTLEAEVVDARGLRYNFAFPKQADYSPWKAIPRHRHPKYAVNLSNLDPELDLSRKYAARHVARELAIPSQAFPIDVQLLFQVRPAPPLGQSSADLPILPAQPYTVATFHFETIAEVRP